MRRLLKRKTESLPNKHTKTLNSGEAFEEASEFARMITFQDDLPGTLGKNLVGSSTILLSRFGYHSTKHLHRL